MKGSSYRERDYAFGQLMLTLRIKLGLTQTELAEVLGVGRRAVIDWEGGLTYPTTDHLKQFVVLAIQRQAFHAGREAEEIRALWQASHQKVLFDEMWLGRLLPDAGSAPASKQVKEIAVTAHALRSLSGGGPRVDWGDAPDVSSFYGRAWELDLLSTWVMHERCRVVSVLGQGGIGKSALATQVMHRVAQDFEVVIWRSLRDVPSCETLLDDCLQVLAPQALSDASSSLESRQNLLLDCLRSRRVLLVYDNLESFLQEGKDSGRVRAGYEGFARVLWRVAGRGAGRWVVEQSGRLWLAILREPVNLQELLAVFSAPLPRSQVLEAVDGLRRRSLIERGKLQGSFTLQSVVMEYVTARLIVEVTSEIKQGRCSRLVEHGLELAPCKDYVRQTQQRLIVAPILAGLRSSYPLRTALEEQLLALLDEQRERADDAQGYGPANLLALLRELRGHLRGLDLSQLSLRGVYLQGVEMQDTTLSGATLQETVFNQSFDPPWSVATRFIGH